MAPSLIRPADPPCGDLPRGFRPCGGARPVQPAPEPDVTFEALSQDEPASPPRWASRRKARDRSAGARSNFDCGGRRPPLVSIGAWSCIAKNVITRQDHVEYRLLNAVIGEKTPPNKNRQCLPTLPERETFALCVRSLKDHRSPTGLSSWRPPPRQAQRGRSPLPASSSGTRPWCGSATGSTRSAFSSS